MDAQHLPQKTPSNDCNPWLSSILPISYYRGSSCRSHHDALAPSSRLAWILRFLNLGNHLLEGCGNVDVQPCASLGEAAVEFIRQLPSLVHRDLSLLGSEVALVADDDQRDPVGALPGLSAVACTLLAEKVCIPGG